MRIQRMVLAVAFLSAVATASAQAPSAGQQAFDKLKTLAGKWEGTDGGGKAAWSRFTLVSNGTVIMQAHKSDSEDYSMLTTYYVDNGRLMITHFCGAGNQPRMVAAGLSLDGQRITFRLHDVTNLTSPETGHMAALEITFVDGEHYTERWTWREGGKDQMSELFQLTRAQ